MSVNKPPIHYQQNPPPPAYAVPMQQQNIQQPGAFEHNPNDDVPAYNPQLSKPEPIHQTQFQRNNNNAPSYATAASNDQFAPSAPPME